MKRCSRIACVSLAVLTLSSSDILALCGNELRSNRYGRRERVHQAFVAGGAEWARRSIQKYERAERDSAHAGALLKYLAYTNSDVAFEYLRALSEDRSRTPTRVAFLAAINALAYTEDPRAVDVGLRLLRTERDVGVRVSAARVVGKTLDFTEVDRPDALKVLYAMEWDRDEHARVRRQAWRGLVKLQRYGLAPDWQHPPELGPPPPIPERLLEESRTGLALWKARHPDRDDVDCPRYLIHCGVRE